VLALLSRCRCTAAGKPQADGAAFPKEIKEKEEKESFQCMLLL
jgi:hypothetical protein